jgi:rhodanese-related sulfurtransferase
MQIASEPYEFTALVGRAITPCLRHVPLGAVILIAALGLGCSRAVTEATTPSDMTAETVTRIIPVDPARAAALLGNSNVIVLDIRTPGEFSKGHLRGATNIDFTAHDFADRVAALDRDQTYLLHCAIGGRSARCLSVFEKLQFKSILHLEGGIRAWRSEGQPVED